MEPLFATAALIGSQTGYAGIKLQTILSTMQEIGKRSIDPVLSVVVIVIITLIVLRAFRSVIRRTIRHVIERDNKPNRELTLKINTLTSVVESGGRLIVIVIAGMMVLSNLGINIAPLIASAGVAGIAIGLGAQSLIRDFIGGFLILFEDQFGVGDVISVNGFSGVVEHISLRRTGIRGANGSFTIVANGDIRSVQNLTKDWSRAVLSVDISYDDDVDRAIALLTELLDGIEDDPKLGSAIIAPAEILGVQSIGPYQVTIGLQVKTHPMEQWGVQRELLRRIKIHFDRAGITMPYPHTVTDWRPANARTAHEPATSMVGESSNPST